MVIFIVSYFVLWSGVMDWSHRVEYWKVQVGKEQEKAQSEKRFPLQKPRREKTKPTIRYLYHENIS